MGIGLPALAAFAAHADVSAKDNDGKTALMIATEKEATDVAELLEAAGARR